MAEDSTTCPDKSARATAFGDLAELPLRKVQGSERVGKEPFQLTLPGSDHFTISLQKQFDELIAQDTRLKSVVAELERKHILFVVLGGWVRDSLVGILRGAISRVVPKDVDLVVTGISHEELATLIPGETARTVFGGVSVAAGEAGVGIDLWSVEETYLVERFGLTRDMRHVLSVTDFNANAATFQPKQSGVEACLVDAGCIDALRRRLLRFHFEWVPLAEAQVARILNIATKVGLSLDDEVKRFVVDVCSAPNAQLAVRSNLRSHFSGDELAKAERLLGDILATSTGRRTKTRLYTNVLGVFEGGGVRGAAFAGAYESARDAGMNFSQVAGTSAGAIAAAFIATGAAPRWIIDELLEVDFACFQGRLAKGQWLRSKWRGVVVLFRRGLAFTPSCWTGMLKAALDVYLYGGAFSSEALETWIDSALKRLLSVNGLKTKGDKVCFRDLPMPLTIVASDIANGSYKIWSQEDSLDESVAFAARCSSSIPLFFQPVRRGDRVFVDGGMLANAPSFVFREKKDDDAATYAARLVTFRLVKRVVAKADLETTGGYFERLGTTVVDGASAIQEELQPSRSDVRIDTGAIGSTDFDKVTDAARRDLVDAGRVAVRSFVENEEATMRGVKDLVRFVGRDQQALFLVQLLSGVPKEVTVYDFSSVWLHICFPSFLKAMRGGTSLRYVCRREADKPELHRRRLFEMMGGVIEHVNEIPFKGVVAYGAKLDGFVLVSDDASPTASYETEVWRAYSSLSDPVFFKLLEARCKQLEGILASPNLPFSPRLELVEDRDLLLARLGRIPQYQGATFRIGDVRLDHGLLTHQTYVKEYKYLQADITVRLLKSLGRDTFDAYAVDLGNGHRTMITPPIVEVSGRERMVVKGHSRALFCLRNGVESMRAVIVEGPQKPLPDSGKRLVDLALASRTRTRTQQYPNVDDTAWRRIEEAVHPEAEFDQL